MGECKRLSSVRKVSSSSSSLRLNRWKAVESSEKRAERVVNWVEKGTAFPGRKCTSAAYSWQELYLRNFVAAPLTCRQVSDESYLVIDMPVEWRSAKFWAAGGGKGHIPSYVHLLLGFVIELPDAWLGFLAYSNLIEGFCR